MSSSNANHVFTCSGCGRQWTVNSHDSLECFFVGICYWCICQQGLSKNQIDRHLRSLLSAAAPIAATPPACEHEMVMTDVDHNKADELKNAILDLCLQHKASVLVALSATRCAAEGLEELINEQGGTVFVAKEPPQSKGSE